MNLIDKCLGKKLSQTDFLSPSSPYEIQERPFAGGAFSKVAYLTRKEDGLECVLKWPKSKSRGHIYSLSKESSFLGELSHENIVSKIQEGLIEGVPCLVLEYGGKTLLELLTDSDGLPFTQIRSISEQALSVLEYLRQLDIAHADLKLHNLLWRDKLSVIDFGLSFKGKRIFESPEGNPATISPEMLSGEEVDSRIDMWGIAVVLFQIFAKEVLFDPEEALTLSRRLSNLAKEHQRVLQQQYPETWSFSLESLPSVEEAHSFNGQFSEAVERRQSAEVENGSEEQVEAFKGLLERMLRTHPDMRIGPEESLVMLRG